jgi:hypothetical protein
MALHSGFNLRNQLYMYSGAISKQLKYVLLSVGIAVVVTAGFVSYRWYSIHRAQAAQKHFAECLQEFNKAAQSGSQSWGVIARIFELGAQEYSSTSMAPFFLAYQAQALLHEDKLLEAAGAMRAAVSKMSKSNELYSLYLLKSILLDMDFSDYDLGFVSSDLLQKLIDLASDKNNKQRDAALYYLGRYYVSKGEDAKARDTLQELVDMQQRSGVDEMPSAWVKEAQNILNQINS